MLRGCLRNLGLCNCPHLRVEGGDDELGGVVLVVRLRAQHARNGRAVLRVERRVDLVKQVERRRVAPAR